MNKSLPALKKGDLIRIISPAKTIDSSFIEVAHQKFEAAGFRVIIGKHALGQHNYFSGTDEARSADLQEGLDDSECKLIVCSRGGYGSIRLVDTVNWDGFLRHPKWFCGFSDITVFLSRIHRLQFQCIHGTMPLNYETNSSEALDSFFNAITGKENFYTLPSSSFNKTGKVSGELVGGNLCILHSLLGTDDRIDYSNKILFIEEVGEQLYSIDRMLHSLKKAGVLDEISGLIIGGMTELKETPIPTNFTIPEMVLHHFKERSIPICFDFPVGHISDNRAMIVGKTATLEIDKEKVTFRQ